MNKKQEQTIKEALNIAIELLTDEPWGDGEQGHTDTRLKTVDKAWDILFNGDEE